MKTVYMTIPAISDELFANLQRLTAENKEKLESEKKSLLPELQKEIEGADTWYTKFYYAGGLYDIDTGGHALEKWSHYTDPKRNSVVTELPTVEVEVEKVTGISEQFMLKALAVISHPSAANILADK